MPLPLGAVQATLATVKQALSVHFTGPPSEPRKLKRRTSAFDASPLSLWLESALSTF